MADDIVIKIRLDADGVESGTRQITAAVEQAGSSADTAARSGFSRLQASLVTLESALSLAQRGFSTFSSVASGAVDALARGGEVAAISTGFETLQGGVEQASVALEELQAATLGTVSNLELMKQANQAVSLGLPTESFDELAEAALKLGRSIGLTATDSIDSLIAAVGRGSTEMLDNLGVVLKTADAHERYAERLGVTTQQLTEQQKAEAFRLEAIQEIIKKSNELGEVELNAADRASQLGVQFTNLKDRLLEAAAENDNLAGALERLKEQFTFTDDELDKLVNRFSKFIDLAADAVQATSNLGDFISNELETLRLGLAALEVNTGEFFKRPGEDRKSGVEEVVNILTRELEVRKSIAETLKENAELRGEEAGVIDEVSGSLDENTGATGRLTKSTSDLIKEEEARIKALRERQKAELAAAASLEAAIKTSDEYVELVKRMNDGTISQQEGLLNLESVIKIVSARQKEATEIQKQLTEAVVAFQSGAPGAAQAVAKLINEQRSLFSSAAQTKKGVDNLGSAFSDVAAAVSGTATGAGGQPSLVSAFQTFGLELKGTVNPAIQGAISNFGALADLGLAAAAGEEIGKVEAGAAIGGVVGAIVGSIFPVIGTALGAAIGTALGGLVGALLESEKSGFANAVDSIDAFFEDLLDEQRISVLIDGQLVEIRDVLENEFQGFFENLDVSQADQLALFEGFEAVGNAITSLLNFGDDIGGEQFGAALGNQLQSLNNLQIFLQGLGVDAEELGKALEQAWLDGDIAASEFFKQSAQIEEIYKKGIPGAVGATDQAMQNLIDSSGVGSLVIDALGDLAAEAGEKGIDSLQALRDDLLNSGADAEKVAQAFDAIAAAGVTNLEGLADVSVQTAATIAANLEGIPDFFTDQIKQINELKEELDQIQDKSVDIELNVRTNIDQNTRDYIEAGGDVGADGLGLN